MFKFDCELIEFPGKSGTKVFSIDFNSTKFRDSDSSLFCLKVKVNQSDSEMQEIHNWTGLMTLIIHTNSSDCDHCAWIMLKYMQAEEEIILNSTGLFNGTTRSVCYSHEINLDWISGVSDCVLDCNFIRYGK